MIGVYIPVTRQHELCARALAHRLLRLVCHRSGAVLATVRVALSARWIGYALHGDIACTQLAAQCAEERWTRRVADVAGLAGSTRVDHRDLAAKATVDVIARLGRGRGKAAAPTASTNGRTGGNRKAGKRELRRRRCKDQRGEEAKAKRLGIHGDNRKAVLQQI